MGSNLPNPAVRRCPDLALELLSHPGIAIDGVIL